MSDFFVYENGDNVAVEFVKNSDGEDLALVPFAVETVDHKDFYFHAVACTEMHPGYDDDTPEVTVGLYKVDSDLRAVTEYRIENTYQIMKIDMWEGFCIAASFAMRGLITLEKPSKFYIYLPSELPVERFDLFMAAARYACKNAGYNFAPVDRYLGQIMLIGVRIEQDGVE